MKSTFVTLTAMVIVALSVSAIAGHTDTLTLGIVMTLLLPVVATLLWRARAAAQKRVRRKIRAAQPQDPLLRSIVLGAFFGLLIAGAAIPVANAVGRMPMVKDFLLDLDQYSVRARVDRAEKQRDWLSAAQILDQRTKRPASTSWRNAMVVRSYADILEALTGDKASASQTALRESIGLVENKLPAPRNAHLAILRLNDQVTNSRIAFDAQLAKSKEETQHATRTLAQSWFDAIVSLASVQTTSFDDRAELYRQAIELATQYGLDSTDAQRCLAILESDRRAAMPCHLPQNATAQIMATWLDGTLPVALITMRLHDIRGAPIKQLKPKDFELTEADACVPIHAFEFHAAHPDKLNLALLLDTSNSTTGAPLAQAKSGIEHVAEQLGPNAMLKTLVFSTTVQTLHDWTDSSNTVEESLAPVSSDGDTALYLALQQGVEELKSQPAPKAILLFTDGDDTVGTLTEDDIIAQIKTVHIPVFVVGLVTKELNQETLIRIARESGGMFLPVTDPAKLADSLSQLARNINADTYRLVTTLSNRDVKHVRVRIGDKNAIVIDVPLPQTSRQLTHHTLAQ